MKCLLQAWEDIKRELTSRDIFLFLDYDGTLAPIAETPAEALMTKDMREVLIDLSKLPRCHLAIISGRKLSDLKYMVDIPNITYAGNHGFEIEGSLLNFESLISPQYQKDLTEIREHLKVKLSSVKGVWLEDKDIIIALHFRLAGNKGASLAKKTFKNVCQSYLNSRRISVTEGKKVLEVRPPIKWDKGEAALWLLTQWRKPSGKNQAISIYVGDDFTDEDAFRVMDGTALTIKIGESRRSLAHYFLRSQEEMFGLLKRISVIGGQYV